MKDNEELLHGAHEEDSSEERHKGKYIAIRIIIEGKVQGVGFRNWMVNVARKLELNGWVRNRRNDSVEALIAGPEKIVREMVSLSYQGPSFAGVRRVREFPCSESPKSFHNFVRLPTI